MKKSVAISIADQGLLSLLNLALNACLVASASPLEFGHYVFASTILLLATSIQNALIATPLSVVYPSAEIAKQPAMRAIILGFDRLFRIACATISIPICMITDSDPLFLAAAAWLVLASLARETQRNLALAEDRARDLIRIDAIAVGLSVVATAALWLAVRPSIAALAGCALGSTLAVWLVGKHRGPADPSPGLKAIASGYAPLWRDTRWGLVGASTIEVQNRAYVFMLEIFRTARDIAEVQAGRLLMGPLPLLVGAWGRVARPVLAKKLAAGDTRAALRIMLTGLACMTVAGLVFAVAIAVAWPLIERVIFRGRYPHVAEMTAAWTIYTLLAISHMVLSAPLIAALRLKELSHVTMVTAVVSLVLLLGLATPVSALFAVGAGIFCELIALVWIAILVHRLFRDLGRSPAPAIPQLLPAAANMGHP